MVEDIFRAGQALRAAHDRDAFPQAVDAFAGRGRGGDVEVHVIRDHEVEMAVAVVVHEGAAGAPGLAGAGDTGFVADVGESAVAVVVVQHVVAVVSDIQVDVAVVVVVTDAHALSPAGVSEACFRRDIGEGAVVIVAVEMAGGARPREDLRAWCR